jgi:hypothetical protein
MIENFLTSSKFDEISTFSRFDEKRTSSRFDEKHTFSRFDEERTSSRFYEKCTFSRFDEKRTSSRFDEKFEISSERLSNIEKMMNNMCARINDTPPSEPPPKYCCTINY